MSLFKIPDYLEVGDWVYNLHITSNAIRGTEYMAFRTKVKEIITEENGALSYRISGSCFVSDDRGTYRLPCNGILGAGADYQGVAIKKKGEREWIPVPPVQVKEVNE